MGTWLQTGATGNFDKLLCLRRCFSSNYNRATPARLPAGAVDYMPQRNCATNAVEQSLAGGCHRQAEQSTSRALQPCHTNWGECIGKPHIACHRKCKSSKQKQGKIPSKPVNYVEDGWAEATARLAAFSFILLDLLILLTVFLGTSSCTLQ